MDCTECEHYRPMSSDGYSSDIKVCRDIFTPKKPEPERKCTNCDGYGRDNCKVLYGIDGCSGQAFKHWRPIPEEPEKAVKKKVCSDCGYNYDENGKAQPCPTFKSKDPCCGYSRWIPKILTEKPGCATMSPGEYEQQLAAQQAQSSAMYGGLLGGSYPFGGSAAQAA